MPPSVNVHFYFFESLDFYFKSLCSLLIWHGSSSSFYENKRTKQLVNANNKRNCMKQKNNGSRPLTAFYWHPPPPKKKKQNKTKQNNKRKRKQKQKKKTKKQNKARPWSTCLQEAIFFACNMSRNFATCWEVWRNYLKKQQQQQQKKKTDKLI